MTTIYVRADTQKAERREHDFYPTPHNLVVRALEELKSLLWGIDLEEFLNLEPQARSVLDVGAGTGRWGKLCRELLVCSSVSGVELRDVPCPSGFDHWYAPQDFCDWVAPGQYDLILSNPPYYIAETCIRKSWEILAPGGWMVFLLRLAFQSGCGRFHGLWNEIYPIVVGTCSRRPSFYGGGTNGTDYGVYYFHKNLTGGTPGGWPRQWMTRLLYYEKDKEKDGEEESKD